MQIKKQQVELGMDQRTSSQLEKEYDKAIYCHPAYLTSMQSTLCEVPLWINHKLESRLLGEISTTSDMYATTLMAESEEELKSVSMRVKEEIDVKASLKLNIQKTKIMASGPIFMANRRGKSSSSDRFSFLGLQNHCGQWLQPRNQKTLAPWKESYDKPRQCIKKQRHHLADKNLSSQSYGFFSSHLRMWE